MAAFSPKLKLGKAARLKKADIGAVEPQAKIADIVTIRTDRTNVGFSGRRLATQEAKGIHNAKRSQALYRLGEQFLNSFKYPRAISLKSTKA